jgi:3-oxoacyl-[acyl-carrier protein] reductase
MRVDLKGKRALVTGASKGLGFAAAMSLAECGATVFMCARNKDNLENAAQKIKSATNADVYHLSADTSSNVGIDDLVRELRNQIDGTDIVFISGGHPPALSLSESKDPDWEKAFYQILNPAIRLTSEFVDGMRQNSFGRFIYISSIYAIEPECSTIIQSTYRAALNSFSKCIAIENAAFGITANTICPGFFDTPLVERLSKEIASKENKNSEEVLYDWCNLSPYGKLGDPSDLGSYVAFLCSNMGKFINGRSNVIDGGALKSY